MSENTYAIKLPLFEGPFDLLLFFIERDELDIYDIPIAKITHDFLDYVHQLQKLNVELASEFILVAATLMRIKAKMLLPRPILDEEGHEIDPREELVKHLLEYKRYKEVVAVMAQMEEARMQQEPRGNVTEEIKQLAERIHVEAEIQDLDLYKLLKTFNKVMQRHDLEQNKPVHQVIQFPYTISEQKTWLLTQVAQKGRLSFDEIIRLQPIKIIVIFNFLSILELLQLQKIKIVIGEGYNVFWIDAIDNQTVEQH